MAAMAIHGTGTEAIATTIPAGMAVGMVDGMAPDGMAAGVVAAGMAAGVAAAGMDTAAMRAVVSIGSAVSVADRDLAALPA
jgi:hypothetical protein